MAELHQVHHVTVSIACPPARTYGFLSQVENWPQWAAGLGSIRRENGEWVADMPSLGTAKIRLVEKNTFGIVDHEVVLPSGEAIMNPMRVLANGGGSEVVFTVFRRPGMNDAQFAADWGAVEKDLRTLKGILEAEGRRGS